MEPNTLVIGIKILVLSAGKHLWNWNIFFNTTTERKVMKLNVPITLAYMNYRGLFG